MGVGLQGDEANPLMLPCGVSELEKTSVMNYKDLQATAKLLLALVILLTAALIAESIAIFVLLS